MFIYSISVHLYFRRSSTQCECKLHFPESTWRGCFSTTGKWVEVKWLRTNDRMNFTLQSISQIVQVASAWSSAGDSDKLNHRKLRGVWVSLVALKVRNPPAMQETWVGKIPWRRERYPPQYSGQENSMDYSMGLQRVRCHWVTFTFTFILF